MGRTPPDPDGREAWARVIATVRPIRGRPRERTAAVSVPDPASARPAPRLAIPPVPAMAARAVRGGGSSADTLDATWDRRLARGLATPDRVIDLHGHTLAAAHGALEAGLAQALAARARLVLLVTGRPPPPGRSRLDDPLRGIIRASVGDWLRLSANAGRIAAVRAAHPRHGGAGALYVVLRRPR